MKKATIQRIEGLNVTKGVFRSGTFTCDTLELPWKDNQHNISCIPAGTYICSVSHMGTMNIDAYLLAGVPNRGGIFIHPGNYAFGKQVDTEGCILIGNAFEDRNSDGTDDVVNSRATFAQFMAYFANEPFELTIIDPVSPIQTPELPIEAPVVVQANPAVDAPAVATPTVQLSWHDKFFNWLTTSSADPEKTSLTVKATLLGLIPMATAQLQSFGINVNSSDLTHSLNVSVKYLAIALFVYGLSRKAYFQIKEMLNN